MVSTSLLIIILVVACLLEWLLVKLINSKKLEELKSELRLSHAQGEDLRQRIEQLNLTLKDKQINELSIIDKANQESTLLKQKNTELETKLYEQTKNLKEQLDNLTTAKEQMKQEFENIAHKIFEERGKTFTEQNKANLDLILNPFRQQINDFKAKVEEVYITEGKERFSLTEQIKKMHEAYESLSHEANNLVRALKADTKTQGDWGEINLRRILDFTGLKEGVHYFTQANYQNEAGENLRPDIVVNLPDNRQIIVDSKVSLTGYERYYSSTNDTEKELGVKDHLKSIRKHVAELSEKKYEDLKGINTLDFVLMFIPVEAAYFVAIDNDSELYKYASEKKVLLVCPSTLLITLQLVGSLWRIDDQKRHVYEIAEQGSKLYDKFVGFVENFETIKMNLDKTLKAYDEAYGQLVEGRGNLVCQAQKLKLLGVKSKKKLSDKILLDADAEQIIPELSSDVNEAFSEES